MYSKRKIIILVSTLLMVILIGAVFGVESFKPKYAYTTSRLNFRSTPNTNTAAIRVLPKNEHIKLIGTNGDYYIIQLESNEVGYVHKNYVSITNIVPNAKTFYRYVPYSASVKYSVVNVRRGPSTSYSKVDKVYKGNNVKVIGKIDNFFVVVLSNNKVGMIREDLVEKTSNNTTTTIPSNVSLEDEVINYINNERSKAGILKLNKDSRLMEISKLKSNEMVKENYFLHTSPTYGTPFTMMKNFGITYLVAGENIAGNSSIKNAVLSWMNSSTHKKNILSTSYNYIGAGVTKSERYGYIISAMFIGK